MQKLPNYYFKNMHTIVIKIHLSDTSKLTANYYRFIISTYNVNSLVKYVHVLDCKTSLMKFNKYLLNIYHVPISIQKDSDIKMKHV